MVQAWLPKTLRTAAAVLLLVPLPLLAQDQESAASRYVVRGREAWDVARRHGFEFFPVIPDDRYLLSGGRDGADATLKACADERAPCTTEAQVVAGEMIVLPPACRDGCARVHAFEMFAGRRLAPGWRIARVELGGESGRWEREPAYDSDDPSFVVRVEARPGKAAAASIARVTLVGPAGADWRDAFGR